MAPFPIHPREYFRGLGNDYKGFAHGCQFRLQEKNDPQITQITRIGKSTEKRNSTRGS